MLRKPILSYFLKPERAFSKFVELCNTVSKSQWRTVSMSTTTELCIDSPASLADEVLDIKIKGLSPKQNITLQAKLVDDSSKEFESHAFYQSNEDGEVHLSSQPSFGGTYSGVEPMGLLWSLQAVQGVADLKKASSVTKKDAQKPLRYDVHVYNGHVKPNNELEKGMNVRPLVSGFFERLFCRRGVRRILVREGRIRGVLFLPPGEGPFPGVIELIGSSGGLNEPKVALLASRGFAALSLAYFGYDDLPRDISTLVLDIDYFEEAADWLLRHPHVNSNLGLGMVGLSLGAQMSMHLASLRKDIKAVVCISPPQLNVLFPVNVKGQVCKCQPVQQHLIEVEDNALVLRGCFSPVPIDQDISEGRIPVEKIDASMLLLCGADDKNMSQPEYCWRIRETLEKHGKGSQCSVVVYPETGHIIDVPYIPNIPMTFHGQYKVYVAYGGQSKGHAHAQIDVWLKTLQFLQKNLVGLQNAHL